MTGHWTALLGVLLVAQHAGATGVEGPPAEVSCWDEHGWSEAPPGPFVQVDWTSSVACGSRPDGTIECWGNCYEETQLTVAGTYTDFILFGHGGCGLIDDGDVECWRWRSQGQEFEPRRSGPFAQLDAYVTATCGVMEDGRLDCWSPSSRLTAVPLGEFEQVAVGSYHACALTTGGQVKCWGNDVGGEATPPDGTFTQLDAGSRHTCGLRTDKTIACWGRNDDGATEPPPGVFERLSVSSPGPHCAIAASGEATCWGCGTPPWSPRLNRMRQNHGFPLSQPPVDDDHVCESPCQPPPALFQQISGTCGITTDGEVRCWNYVGREGQHPGPVFVRRNQQDHCWADEVLETQP